MLVRIVRIGYFWLFLLMNIGLFGWQLAVEYPAMEPLVLTDYVSFATLPLGLVGLFGYAYGKPLMNQWIWVIVVSVILLNEVIYGSFHFLRELYLESERYPIHLPDLVYPILAFLLFVPYYIGISKYAFIKRYWKAT